MTAGRPGRYLGPRTAPGSAWLQSASGDMIGAPGYGMLDQAAAAACELRLQEEGS